eukprot:scaffold357755_cov17-Prasinocladus_malaysianus.AAC.1
MSMLGQIHQLQSQSYLAQASKQGYQNNARSDIVAKMASGLLNHTCLQLLNPALNYERKLGERSIDIL